MARTFRFGIARRAGNAVIKRAIALGVAPSAYVLLTVRGRRTGQPRTIPIRLLEHEGQRWLVAPYGPVEWVRNARAAGEVTLRHGKRSWSAQVAECGRDDAAHVLREYVRVEPVTRPYFDVAHDGPIEGFAAEAARHPVFLVVEQ